MKVRNGFVSNSSSSSFVIVYEKKQNIACRHCDWWVYHYCEAVNVEEKQCHECEEKRKRVFREEQETEFDQAMEASDWRGI
jgi:hypothetical protein